MLLFELSCSRRLFITCFPFQIAEVIKKAAVPDPDHNTTADATESDGSSLIPQQYSKCAVKVSRLEELYKAQYGYELVPERFGKNDLVELLSKC